MTRFNAILPQYAICIKTSNQQGHAYQNEIQDFNKALERHNKNHTESGYFEGSKSQKIRQLEFVLGIY